LQKNPPRGGRDLPNANRSVAKLSSIIERAAPAGSAQATLQGEGMSTPQTQADPKNPATRTARPHPAQRLTRAYRVSVVVGLFAAIIYLGASARLWPFQAAPESERAASDARPEVSRTGTIVLRPNPDQCAQATFDNNSGKFGESRPCDEGLRFDEYGKPIPLGTMHRLDAISRSFLGR